MRILTIIVVVFAGISSCKYPVFKSSWTKEKAPAFFTARFETSKGNFDLRIQRDFSPQSADRFYQLVRHRYFNNILFYRVVPGFVAQFGNIDTTLTQQWEKYTLADEPVLQSNIKGSISFARAGKETRGTHLFINLADNKRLDTMQYNGVTGFPVFGHVVNGMENILMLYNGYSNSTMEVSDSLGADKKKILSLFPKLDSVKKAYIIKAAK
ncbi:MAG: peptidylprolyl isomerase [Sphingobacteriales bacterium]|nr:MAG: peptidylprolyl isomerase [Sphingobacteriales bacterium]